MAIVVSGSAYGLAKSCLSMPNSRCQHVGSSFPRGADEQSRSSNDLECRSWLDTVIFASTHPKVGTMTRMNSAGSVNALPDAGAPFRNRARAWALTAAALPVATVSFLIGIASYDVEDDQANVIQCGHMLFHAGPRPSPFCDAVPFFWGVIAEVGLFIAVCMVCAAIAFAIRCAVGRRANRASP